MYRACPEMVPARNAAAVLPSAVAFDVPQILQQGNRFFSFFFALKEPSEACSDG